MESMCSTTQNAVLKSTAGIISLLTHICIPVALNIDVHPKLTHQPCVECFIVLDFQGVARSLASFSSKHIAAEQGPEGVVQLLFVI